MASQWSYSSLMVVIVCGLIMRLKLGESSPETMLLTKGCSTYNISNQKSFFRDLNASFVDLRIQLNNGDDKRFATTQQPVYAMVQCRNYLSKLDCVACYDAAVSEIHSCSDANGARVLFDGCLLRYESNYFYDETTFTGNVEICQKRKDSQEQAINTTTQKLLNDLIIATPRTTNFFAATKKEVGVGDTIVYAVAQCIQTITEKGCRDCLTVAHHNIQGCIAKFGEGRAVDAGCFLRYSHTPFFLDNQTIDITPFFVRGISSSKKNLILACAVGVTGLILTVITLLLWYQRSSKPKENQRGNVLGTAALRGPMKYKYRDLKTGTNNFSEANKLGGGGFGDVYECTFKNGNVVAVKKLMLSRRAKDDFEIEVRILSNVHHRNIIHLLGCSKKESVLLLVYEYMENSSLDRYLFGDKQGTLNWKQRFDIILGTAKGLAYLHEQYHVCIIHRDVKASNILLDDYFQPKIADFGLARFFPENHSHLSTKFAGTLGYIAPEYAMYGHLTEKVDTYAFGVVILEIISGCRSSHLRMEPSTEFLLKEAWKLHENEKHLKLVDKSLDPRTYKAEEMKKVIEIALMCTQSPANLRPSMSEVIVMLTSDIPIELKSPSKPTFIDFDKRLTTDASASAGMSTLGATQSFTDFTSR